MTHPKLFGKRVGMVTFSCYPSDPRPRRALNALRDQGMSVDLICLSHEGGASRESTAGLDVLRVPIQHKRGGIFSYVWNYWAFIFRCTVILAARSVHRRYDLIYVHNMPDFLVACGIFPKLLGARVILDQHDPMPELMKTIFSLRDESVSVRLMKWLEKWSIARANAVVTVNIACKRIFASRSCRPEKVTVVMNAPDGELFPFRAAEDSRRRDSGTDRRFVIMYHGSLVKRNGLDLAVEALALVRRRIPTAELQIYGNSTSFLEQVMEQVRSLGLEHAVRYLGPRRLEDLADAIDGCDVGVIPNHRIAFTDINTPTRIFEYLAGGKPVIAPRTAGIEDYFDPDSLVFFDCGDVAELALKIEHVFARSAEALETTRRGQEIYLAHTWNEERRGLMNLVSDLLA
jgi:glycosyltransferase involved in cell wall biosynthesis